LENQPLYHNVEPHFYPINGVFDIITPSTRDICLPIWSTKIVEVIGVDAGDVNDSKKDKS
jgi:hypothetical protein